VTFDSSLTVAWFASTNHNSLPTHSNQWYRFICIDHRSRQMAFFVFVKMGKAPPSRALREIKQLLCEQSLILYYIKQIDSMLPCICPLIDHRGRQTVVRKSVTHSAIVSCATFFVLTTFSRHLWSTKGQMHGNMESISICNCFPWQKLAIQINDMLQSGGKFCNRRRIPKKY